MKRTIALLLFTTTLGLAEVEDKETINRQFTVSGSSPEIVVDNVSGFIHVKAYIGSTVQATIVRTTHGRSPDRLLEAKQDVKLDITERPGTVRLYVDGPFRDHDGHRNDRGSGYYGYEVRYDFELLVPASSQLYLRTVNEGDITASGTSGDFDIGNVNAPIHLSGMGGSGKAHTVNGGVAANFTRSPQRECSFATINGKVDLTFPRDLAANFQVKTMNGEMFTDFPLIPGPQSASKLELTNGKHQLRANQYASLEAGKGGPPITITTLNGNIEIRQK